MSRLLFFVSMMVVCASCGQSSQSSGTTAIDTINTISVSDTCAVIYRPAGDKLRSLKNAFGEKSFPGMMAFNSTTLSNDSAYLAGKGLKVISTSKPTLKFLKRNGEVITINFMVAKYSWEIFLFNTFNDPVQADLTDIESAVQEAAIIR